MLLLLIVAVAASLVGQVAGGLLADGFSAD
jgi:hypothetical protein